MRYVYSYHHTLDAAEAALDDYYADGAISENEQPRIIKRGNRYAITLRNIWG